MLSCLVPDPLPRNSQTYGKNIRPYNTDYSLSCDCRPNKKSISYTPEPVPPSFSDWHWPLPAGDWQIDRGPCDSPLANNHGCDNYEGRSAFDFSAIAGESENTPVLAPQSGRVVYVGQRLNTGIEVMLVHPDGRVSALYHLSKAVVEVDQYIEQGQVVGYTGHTGTTKSRLHFHVQPNAVTRQCLPIQGLDEMDYPSATITSFNTSMEHLMLVNPPQPLSGHGLPTSRGIGCGHDNVRASGNLTKPAGHLTCSANRYHQRYDDLERRGVQHGID